jgi:hypothetical protein
MHHFSHEGEDKALTFPHALAHLKSPSDQTDHRSRSCSCPRFRSSRGNSLRLTGPILLSFSRSPLIQHAAICRHPAVRLSRFNGLVRHRVCIRILSLGKRRPGFPGVAGLLHRDYPLIF